jgi:AcrR family transcriptional regulator
MLSLEAIVGAAVAIAVREGVDAVAMSRVAHALGVGTMSLYRHVEGKRELLALMVDSVFAQAPAAPGPRERWRTALTRWAAAHLDVLRRHPWVVRVPISGPPVTPNQVRWFEHGLRSLAPTGLKEGEKLAVLLLVNGVVRNHATLEADLAASAAEGGIHDSVRAYGATLQSLIDAERFPALSRLFAAADRDGPESRNGGFDFALARVLDGVAALVGR